MLVEYDILSSAGNRSFANTNGAVSGAAPNTAPRKQWKKYNFNYKFREGFKKWRKAK
jgi:hypothetical protein